MLLAIIGGETPKANNEAERQVRDLLTRDVEEILRQGWIVEIPYDLPDF